MEDQESAPPAATRRFLFVRMNNDRTGPAGWRPQFIDCLYVSLTNAVGFSPTDTMRSRQPPKSIIAAQSIVSLVTIGLIVSRAINIG